MEVTSSTKRTTPVVQSTHVNHKDNICPFFLIHTVAEKKAASLVFFFTKSNLYLFYIVLFWLWLPINSIIDKKRSYS